MPSIESTAASVARSLHCDPSKRSTRCRAAAKTLFAAVPWMLCTGSKMPAERACQIDPLKKSVVPCVPPAHTAVGDVPHTASSSSFELLVIVRQPEPLQAPPLQPAEQVTKR